MNAPATPGPLSRTAPNAKVLEKLFILSMNRCVLPDCTNPLVDQNGIFVGHICQIETSIKGGPRQVEERSFHDLRRAENLVLVCSEHLEAVAGKASHLSAGSLHEMKDQRESMMQNLGRRMREEYRERVGPADGLIRRRRAKAQSPGISNKNKMDHENSVKKAPSFARQLSQTSDADRERVVEVIKFAFANGFVTPQSINIPLADLVTRFSLNFSQAQALTNIFIKNELGETVDPSGRGHDYHLRIWNPSRSKTWSDVQELYDASDMKLSEFLRTI